MAYKSQLKDRKGEILYPVTLADCILDVGVDIVPSSGTSIEVVPNKYYRFDERVNTLEININGDDVTYEKVASLEIFLTTGDSPAITIDSQRGYGIKYFSGFNIEPNTSYELNIMWNGYNWIVAYGIVE